MIDAVGILKVAKPSWGNYDFSKPSLAVVALGEDGQELPCLLWTVGAHVRMEIEEAGLTFGELGLEPDEPGIWIWEGVGVWSPGGYECPDDGSIELVGKFRKPTDEEWTAIRCGCCPWDDEQWKLPEQDRQSIDL